MRLFSLLDSFERSIGGSPHARAKFSLASSNDAASAVAFKIAMRISSCTLREAEPAIRKETQKVNKKKIAPKNASTVVLRRLGDAA